MDTFNLQKYFEFIGFDVYDWVLVFAGVFLLLEIVDDILNKRMNKNHFFEIAANLITQIPYYIAEIFVFGIYVYVGFYIYESVPWKMPVTVAIAIFALFLVLSLFHLK